MTFGPAVACVPEAAALSEQERSRASWPVGYSSPEDGLAGEQGGSRGSEIAGYSFQEDVYVPDRR